MVEIKKEKNKIILVSVCCVVFIIFQFFLLDFWEQQRIEESAIAFQRGFDFGLENAVFTIYNNTENCQITTISVGNDSKKLVDFTCNLSDYLP